jgi:hypothetical protein
MNMIFISKYVQFKNTTISYTCLTFINYYYPYYLWPRFYNTKFYKNVRKTFSSVEGFCDQIKLETTYLSFNSGQLMSVKILSF